MLVTHKLEPKNPPKGSVIWLHGLGSNGQDLMNLVPQFHLEVQNNIRFIFPDAPKRPITINGGFVMPAWYDIITFADDGREDLAGLRVSQHEIDLLIQQEINQGIPADKIMLGGFSQGGALTLFTGLQSQHTLGGLIVLSAYLPSADYTLNHLAARSSNPPIFMAHGMMDSIVLPQWGESAKNILLSKGFLVDFRTYPMRHEVCALEIQSISHFISALLR